MLEIQKLIILVYLIEELSQQEII